MAAGISTRNYAVKEKSFLWKVSGAERVFGIDGAVLGVGG